MKQTLLFCLLTLLFNSFAQEIKSDKNPNDPAKPAVKFNPFDGTIIAGYVDNGAFLNFTGPNISFTHKSSKIILGMLPSLRYKEDNGVFRNSPITPGLGFGLTYCWKKLAVQIPIYYNAKTATANGRWNLGVGIGMRLK